MKLYRDAPQASIKMEHDPDLVAKLELALRNYGIDVAIETGTYHGTGSTRMLAETFSRIRLPMVFVTFEANFRNWLTAYRNLRELPFIHSLWGCSVDLEGALAFVRQDEAIAHHGDYPDIFIDNIDDPVGFYSREIEGVLGRRKAREAGSHSAMQKTLAKFGELWGAGGMRAFSESTLREYLWSGEALLAKYLALFGDNKPLIVLDSAGGCGWYEYQTVMRVMADKSFLLMLDDTHHLKHFRSLKHMLADPRFEVIGHSPYHGWALAWHQ